MNPFILISVLVAAFLGTLTGFGTSTILIPLLSLSYPFVEVLLFVGIVHWFGNLWKMIFFRSGASRSFLWSFGVPGLVASVLGASLTLSISQYLFEKLFGVFLLFYSALIYAKPTAKLPKTLPVAALGGILSGLAAGVFGVGGAIRAVFLSAFGLKKAAYLFTAGAMGLVIDSSRLVTYWTGGATVKSFGLLLLFVSIPISFIGAWIAQRTVNRLPQHAFRFVVITALTVLGVRYLLV